MDFKHKVLALAVSLVLILTIVTAVVGINLYKGSKQQKPGTAESGADAEAGAYGVLSAPGFVDLSAFEQDETFFDREPSEFEKRMESLEKNLSLYATSVERDLRVRIVNDEGELVAGHELYVTVGEEQYKDLDQDGVIYVADLKPGEYEIRLLQTEDFRVPKAPIYIEVRANVEYTPIDDISLLIKTEAEVIAELEDSKEGSAKADSDGSDSTEVMPSEGTRSFGIDVSKWNKVIDWQTVKAQGVDFAIIRCGYRGSVSGSLIEDPLFFVNLQGAKEAGVDIGLYFFTQATSEVEAVEEASMVLALNNRSLLQYPIFIDTEGAGGSGRADGLDSETRTKVCRAFCETIENAGYRAGIYASRNWLDNRLDITQLSDYTIWLAEYTDSPKYGGKYEMWQYTSRGKLEGIEGNVDFNLSYGLKK